jgi:quercetin dioxygenase-like cupin family protein
MKIFKIKDLTAFSPEGFNKTELHVTEQSKVLSICFAEGQAVDPCVMSRNTMFYIVEGEGIIRESDLEESVSPGSIILIEPEKERQLIAKTKLIVLAVQYA